VYLWRKKNGSHLSLLLDKQQDWAVCLKRKGRVREEDKARYKGEKKNWLETKSNQEFTKKNIDT
jgi:hypothetical protein